MSEFSGVERRVLQDRLFKAILNLNIILLIFDSLEYLLSGRTDTASKILLYNINTIDYIIFPLPLMLWVLYTDYYIFQNEKRLKKLSLFCSFPMVVNAIIVIINPFNNLMFYLDDKNIYHRGHFFMVLALTCYIYILLSAILIIRNKDKIESKKFIPMLIYPLPTLIGGILQNIFFGVSTIWIGSTLSVLILFLSIQNSRLNTDYLTGLYNRRQLDNYLMGKIRNSSVENKFAGIMIDVDEFKSINDIYGHHIGDEALSAMAKLLKKGFPNNDLIVRYAGDEFVIIKDIKDTEDLKASVNRLNSLLINYNKKSNKPYDLNISLGCAIYDHKLQMTSEQFIKHIDKLMYKEKNIKKIIKVTTLSQ